MKRNILITLVTALNCITNLQAQKAINADKVKEANQAIEQLSNMEKIPKVWDEQGNETTIQPGKLQKIFYQGLDYNGKKTRIYAWIGVPAGASSAKKVPAMVLVHGGGGTAFKNWVEKWNTQGYAAISIAVEGQIDSKAKDSKAWLSHQYAGPKRVGIYGDSDKPIKNQWMYHSVADTILANSLIRSLDFVDSQQVGLMGISWGGVITSTVIGIDHRFNLAIPVYGCGDLSDAANLYGRALGKNAIYKEAWDPILRMKKVTIPVMWFTWPRDFHFPINKVASCYSSASGQHQLVIIPGMKHGHGPAIALPDAYAFAKSVNSSGSGWIKNIENKLEGNTFTATFKSTKPITECELVYATTKVVTGSRDWQVVTANAQKQGDRWVATAQLPKGASSWFLNVKSGNLIGSSDFQEN